MDRGGASHVSQPWQYHGPPSIETVRPARRLAGVLKPPGGGGGQGGEGTAAGPGPRDVTTDSGKFCRNKSQLSNFAWYKFKKIS